MKNTVIFDQPQEKIVFGILGDTYIYANERQIEVVEPRPEGEPQTVTRYEYDERHFPLYDKTEAGALTALKNQLISELDKFDNSDAVNSFSVGGLKMWLDKETRNGLRLRFDSQKALGQTDTTLWYGVNPLPLNIDNAIQMLTMLEVYASQCFDRTAEHKKNILSLQSIDDVFNYDYTQGYPAQLAF